MLLSEEMKKHEKIEWYEPKVSIFRDFLKVVEMWKESQMDHLPHEFQMDPQLIIQPHVSISIARRSHGSKRSSKHSKSSSSESTSSVSSARLKVAAERAAVLAHAARLKGKHALEMEQAQLKTKMEQMELELSLTESDAKSKVQFNCKAGSKGYC